MFSIGKIIKDSRKSLGIKLLELSRLTGIAVATLSRIENGRMTGTLESHAKIARALNLPLHQLYQPRSLQKMTRTHAPSHSYRLHAECIPLSPGSKTHPDKGSAGSDHYIYVLEGAVEVVLDKGKHKLEQGHSLTFKGTSSFYYRNPGRSLARLLSVRGVKEASE